MSALLPYLGGKKYSVICEFKKKAKFPNKLAIADKVKSILFIDFNQAFDSVNHKLLFEKL